MASSAYAQNFEQALASVYQHDPSLQAERAKLRATDESVPIALSNWRPDVEATGNVGKDREEIEGFNNEVLAPKSAGVTVTQPIFRGFRTVGSVDSAEASVQAGRAELMDAEQQLLLQAAKAYLDVLEAQEVLDLNRKNEDDLNQQFKITQERLHIGDVKKTDVSQAESRLEVAKATRLQAEGDLQNKKVTYERLFGESPKMLEPVKITLENPKSQDEAVELAAKNNPKVIAASFNETGARADVTTAEGSLLPEVSLQGSATNGYNQSVTIPQHDNSYIVMAKMTVPLYRSGSDYAKSRAAIQTAEQRTMELLDAKAKAKESVINAWQSFLTAQQVIEVNKAAVAATDRALYGVKQEALGGIGTTLDVLNAKDELFTSRINLVKAIHDEQLAVLQLKSSIGALTADALNLPVERYDPNEHYENVHDKWIGLGS